jgi:hypothetical protein
MTPFPCRSALISINTAGFRLSPLSFPRLQKLALRWEPAAESDVHHATNETHGGLTMGRGLLLWMIGIPLPIILVIWLFGGLS